MGLLGAGEAYIGWWTMCVESFLKSFISCLDLCFHLHTGKGACLTYPTHIVNFEKTQRGGWARD